MKVKSNLTIGNATFQFEVEEKDDKEAMLKSIALATPRGYCNVCKDSGLATKRLEARKSQGFVFVSVVCKCGAKSAMGEYKDGGYFWKEYELYQKGETQTKPNRSAEDLAKEDMMA